MFSPAHHKHPDETALIGLLVIGYTELDLALCHVSGLAMGNKEAALNALHKVESEGLRIEMVNALTRHIFIKNGVEAEFGETIGAIRYCRKVRNQYTHAQWKSEDGRLCFAQIRGYNWEGPQFLNWNTTGLALLREQEAYFEYTRKYILGHEWILDHPDLSAEWPQHLPKPKLFIDIDPDTD